MPVNTLIDGDPGDIARVGDWVREVLATAVSAAGDEAASARRRAGDAWDGEASEFYLDVASRFVHEIDGFHGRVLEVANRFHAMASALRGAQDGMADICDDAASAGLRVHNGLVEDPPPHADSEMRDAYDTAQTRAGEIHAEWIAAVTSLTSSWTNEAWAATFTTTTLIDTASNNAALTARHLLASRDKLETLALGSGRQALALSGTADFAEAFAKVRSMFDEVAGIPDKAADLKSFASRLGKASGAIGMIAGVGLDVHSGESLEQAVVSNGTGLAAGIAASSAAGALIGSWVPGIGTLAGGFAGALIGTATGIFASGGVDYLYETGDTSVDGVIGAGMDEINSAWHATRDLGDAVVGGIRQGVDRGNG